MSALTSGPDTVICIPRVVIGVDRTGSNKLGPGEPVEYIGVSVQPAGLAAFGGAEFTGYDYVIFKSYEPAWVGGPHSTVMWNGVEYYQLGVPQRYGRGRNSKHETIKLKARGVEVA